MQRRGQLKLIVILTGLAMVMAPMAALASHNDVGTRMTVVQGDEVDEDGSITPDIPRGSFYDQVRFHVNLEDQGLPARMQPEDQTGARYTSGCTESTEDGYDEGLSAEGDSCYIGYLDLQWEYQLEDLTCAAMVFCLNEDFPENSASLYPVNPDDDYCKGEEDPEAFTGNEEADQVLTRANRTASGLTVSDHECDGSGHDWDTARHLWVDADLLEPAQFATPLHGEDETSVAPPGSGYNTLPYLAQSHILIYGQPHPDAKVDEADRITAAEVNAQMAGLAFPTDDPCGSRTAECVMLTPEDIRLYDSTNPKDVEESTVARVCEYSPQFGLNGGTDLATDCGPQGSLVQDFFDDFTSGGLAADDLTGGAPTWIGGVPGWFGSGYIALGEGSSLLWTAMEMEDIVTDPCCGLGLNVFAEGGQEEYGTYVYIAVNPKVPKGADPTWCVRPGFLADGESDVDLSGESDPGVYGTYVADGIDTDVRPGTGQTQYLFLEQELKGPVRDGPVESPVPIPEDVQGIPLDNDPDDDKIGLREIENLGAFITDTDTDAVDLPPEVTELLNRTDYDESSDPDPDVPTPETDLAHPLRYQRTIDPGLRCDNQGLLSFVDDPVTQEGAVQFNLNVIANSDKPAATSADNNVWLKDPTAVSEFMGVPLPEDESKTQRSGWQVDHYDFNGITRAQVDSNGDGDFDGCIEATGQPQPDLDFCHWEGIWDVYNDECTNAQDKTCGEVAENLSYDLDAGVGLYFVIQTDGPTIVEDESAGAGETPGQFTVLGDEDTTATHCIVGTSQGFLPKLTDASGVNGFTSESDLLDKVCGDADGEVVLFEDAFTDQPSPETGSYGSNIQFHKLVPTPDAADDLTGWEGFEICVTGIWNVETGETAGDSTDYFEITGHNEFSDCDAFYDA